MNIKTKKIFISLFLLTFILIVSVKEVNAGCCVGSSSCSSASSSESCTTGSYNSSDCSSISSCSGSSGSSDKSSTSSGSSTTISFSNPLNATTLSGVLTSLLSSLKSVVIIIAVIFIIIGGLMYMMSGGNEKTITRAKACVTGAVIGLAIVLAAPIFLNEIIQIFGGSSELSTGSSMRLKTVATNVLGLLLSVLGIIAIISLVVGGGMYLTSYGDEKKIETAKRTVKYALIGIVISLASLVIVSQIGKLLGETVSSSGTSTSTTSSLSTGTTASN